MAGQGSFRRRERSSTPLDNYLREINDTPLLSADEEKRLAYRIQEGDTTARDHMVRANLRLVVNISRTFTGRGLDLQDLIAEGNLGLIRAVEAFDPDMNTRLSTYASFWIRQSMKRAVINTGKTIRVPAYMAQLLSEWRRAAAALNDELGRPATEEEIAKKLRLSPKKLNIVKKALRIYQGSAKGQGEAEIAEADLLVDERSVGPAAALFQADELRQVMGLLDRLETRDATVLRLRFGLTGEEPLTLLQIGERLGLTRERVRQIERDALAKLAELMQGGEEAK